MVKRLAGLALAGLGGFVALTAADSPAPAHGSDTIHALPSQSAATSGAGYRPAVQALRSYILANGRSTRSVTALSTGKIAKLEITAAHGAVPAGAITAR